MHAFNLKITVLRLYLLKIAELESEELPFFGYNSEIPIEYLASPNLGMYKMTSFNISVVPV